MINAQLDEPMNRAVPSDRRETSQTRRGQLDRRLMERTPDLAPLLHCPEDWIESYKITALLLQSETHGVYACQTRDGTPVVLREDKAGGPALIRSLAGHPCFNVQRGFELGESSFTVLTDSKAIGTREQAGTHSLASLKSLLRALLPALEAMHVAGLVHGEISARTVRTFDHGLPGITEIEYAKYSDDPRPDIVQLAAFCRDLLAPEARFQLDTLPLGECSGEHRGLIAALRHAANPSGPIDTLQMFRNMAFSAGPRNAAGTSKMLSKSARSLTFALGIGTVSLASIAFAPPIVSPSEASPAAPAMLPERAAALPLTRIVDQPILVERLSVERTAIKPLDNPLARTMSTARKYAPLLLTLNQPGAKVSVTRSALPPVAPAIQAEAEPTLQPIAIDPLLAKFKQITNAGRLFAAPNDTAAEPLSELAQEPSLTSSPGPLAVALIEPLPASLPVPVAEVTSIEPAPVEATQIAHITAPDPIAAPNIMADEPATGTPLSLLPKMQIEPAASTPISVTEETPAPTLAAHPVESAPIAELSSRPAEPIEAVSVATPAPVPVTAPASIPEPTLAPVAAVSAPPATDTNLGDCDACPEMIDIPGTGTLAGFAIGKTEVTVGAYKAYLLASGLWSGKDGEPYLGMLMHRSPLDPGFPQDDHHPVTFVSYEDAQNYAAWLSRKTANTYRLPTEAEWLHAAGGNAPARFVWGNSARHSCQQTNGADTSLTTLLPGHEVQSCTDGHATTASVASFPANGFDLHDMSGNVAEWTSICQANETCRIGVVRGGSWSSALTGLELGISSRETVNTRDNRIGFRLVRTGG